MEKFHIVITDNETGETRCEYDTNVIVAAIDTKEAVHGINCIHCTVPTLALVLDCAMCVVRENLQDHPELLALMTVAAQRNKLVEKNMDE